MSSCQIRENSGSPSHTAATVMAWPSSSTTTAETWVSRRIQRTWSVDDVGYTGTTRAPTVHRANANSVHS